MRKILLAAALIAFSGAAWAQGVPNSSTVVAVCGTPPTTYTPGQNKANLQDANGNQCIYTTPSSSPQATNVTQVNGNTISTGAGATGTGSPRVGVAQDTTTIAGAAPGTAAAPSTNVISTVRVSSAAASAGVAPVQTPSLAGSLVAKNSAGNLHSFEVSADSTLSGAAWWVLFFNATSVPADGAVAPAMCYAAKSGDTRVNDAFSQPVYFSTGIVIVASTTGCFSKTISAHAFAAAGVQ